MMVTDYNSKNNYSWDNHFYSCYYYNVSENNNNDSKKILFFMLGTKGTIHYCNFNYIFFSLRVY